MRLSFDLTDAEGYTSNQRVRRMSESWVGRNLYCVACAADRIERLDANSKARDFICARCGEVYELKATRARLAHRNVDGAHDAMAARIVAREAPNLLLLGYRWPGYEVADLVVVPKYFLTLDSLLRRKPLSERARRAGWVGCIILLDRIPASGRLHLVRNSVAESQALCRSAWRPMLFLRQETRETSWLIAVLNCVQRLPATFSLAELYRFEPEAQDYFPRDTAARENLRQQLQRLRDTGQLDFVARVQYRRLEPTPVGPPPR